MSASSYKTIDLKKLPKVFSEHIRAIMEVSKTPEHLLNTVITGTLAACAACIGDRYYFGGGESPVYANIMLYHIGESTTGKGVAYPLSMVPILQCERLLKKYRDAAYDDLYECTISLRKAKAKEKEIDHIQEAQKALDEKKERYEFLHHINPSMEEFTAPALYRRMSYSRSTCITAQELNKVISGFSSACGVKDVATHINQLYHGLRFQKNLKMQVRTEEVRRPCLGMFIQTTKNELPKIFHETHLQNGSLARPLFSCIFSTDRARISDKPYEIPKTVLQDIVAEIYCDKILTSEDCRQTINGRCVREWRVNDGLPAEFTDEASAFCADYEDKAIFAPLKSRFPQYAESLTGKCSTNLKKIAVIFSALSSRRQRDTEGSHHLNENIDVSIDHAMAAAEVMLHLLESQHYVLHYIMEESRTIHSAPVHKLAERLLRCINFFYEKNSGAKLLRSEVVKKFGKSKDGSLDFKRSLEILVSSGQVEEYYEGSVKYLRKI